MIKSFFIKMLNVFLHSTNARSLLLKKNIVSSFLLKMISFSISLLIVPMTINYVNPTKYGIWLTLSSIISWLSYFDLGFANGFRNRFTEARASGNNVLARQYVSTAYAVLSLLFLCVGLLATIVNRYIDWSAVLNIDDVYREELRLTFGLLTCFFCIDVVAKIFTTMLTADQKPAVASLITTVGQVCALITIYLLTKLVSSGSLVSLAVTFSFVPCLVLILFSIVSFTLGRYKEMAPSVKYVQFGLTKKILSLGTQFFLIMVSMLFIYQCLSVIILRVLGAEAVTQYNVANRIFTIVYMACNIIIAPFWSAFTDAYVKLDYTWMRAMVKKLEKVWLFGCIPLLVVLLVFSDFIYDVWIGESVDVPFALSVSMALYVMFQTVANIYMYLINGTSKVRVQLIVYASFALISVPMIVLSCHSFGIAGAVIVPALVYAIQAIVGKVQITKLIEGRATGIWNK